MGFLDKKWSTLKSDDEKILEDERKRKLCEGIPSIIFLVIVLLETYFTHFLLFSYRGQSDITKEFIPITELWDFFEGLDAKDIANSLFIPLVASAAFAIISGITVAILLGCIKRGKIKIPTLCPETKSFDSAIAWAKALKRRLQWSPRYFIFAIIIAILWIVGITAIVIHSFNITKNIGDQLVVGGVEALLYLIAWGFLNWFVGVPKYDLSSHFKDIIKDLETEKEKQEKFNKLIQLYIDNKYDEARELAKSFKNTKSGDINAIKILTAKLETDATEQVRKAYDSLWKAKDLGFVNDKIRQAVDEWLSVLTPTVKLLAQDDMLKAYTYIIADQTDRLVYDCAPHVEYGHPDAVVIQIYAYIRSERLNNPDRYEAWLKDLKMAKRRGVSEEFEEFIEMLITKLDDQIRINKEYERIERRRAATYTPTYSMGGPISSWAEPSGWTDFRTGETLYRVEGRIVNGNGEEVSVAWWE